MKGVVTVGCLVLLAGPAAGQVAPPRDSATQRELPALLISLRDAVDRVSAAANEFRRDLRTVGDDTVLGRALQLEKACRETRQTLADAPARLRAARLEPYQVAARDSLVAAIGTLTAALRRECEGGLAPMGPGSRADTLRAWGPNRTSKLTEAVNGYHGAAARLARRIGADLTRH